MVKLLILWIHCICFINGAKILGIFPIESYSHHLVFQSIWRELSLQGHEVTVLTPFPSKDPKLVNLTEIRLGKDNFGIMTNVLQSVKNLKHHSHINDVMLFMQTCMDFADDYLSFPEIQELIHNRSKYHFDLILVEYLFSPVFPFKDVFNCPLVGIQSCPVSPVFYSNLGMPYHPVLNPFVVPTGDLSFMNRVYSFLFKFVSMFLLKPLASGELDTKLKKYFGENIRSIDDISRDFSLVLVNDNLVLQDSTLTVPAYVPITGVHLKPQKPLPDDLKKILDESKHGVIYVSFGSNFKVHLDADETITKFVNVFKKLPYTILWKQEVPDISVLPKNVVIRKWFPQQDVLAHPKVKLFITQGGVQSLEESLYNYVPVLCMPHFADQWINGERMANLGGGLYLDFHTFKENDLYTKINTIITDPKYKTRIKELSAIAFDQPMKGVDQAVWHINYVLRHKGAKHLRYKALDLPWYIREMLDVYFFLFVIVVVILYSLKMILQILVRFILSNFKVKRKDKKL